MKLRILGHVLFWGGGLITAIWFFSCMIGEHPDKKTGRMVSALSDPSAKMWLLFWFAFPVVGAILLYRSTSPNSKANKR
jgi:hypothetical protein